ncbi:hypothetical protein DY000_02015947 [Brassica cretica]|uniref:Uncharacterized protein n=1 Tax=Brassica cretica TaxID=69181 RepID=A0ABQ7DC15_BRACR|nr:hypothetical protein DY000_02015947 [Brassica cretica]
MSKARADLVSIGEVLGSRLTNNLIMELERTHNGGVGVGALQCCEPGAHGTELKGETSLITIRGALKYLPILPPTELNFHRLRDRPAHSLSPQIPLSQVSHTPSLRPLKEPMQPVSAAASGSMNVSSDRRSALERLAPAKDRLFALERLSPAGSYNGSQERCSALACIYLPSDREPLPQLERLSPAGTFEIRYLQPDVPFADGMGASGLKVPTNGFSPIRSLIEDIIHVSLCLGSIPAELNQGDLPAAGPLIH